MSKASKIVSSAIIGADVRVFVVNSKQYAVHPPTIYKLSGAISFLSDIDLSGDMESKAVFVAASESFENCTKALSWFIIGKDDLYEELRHGTTQEIINGIKEAISLISITDFLEAVSLAKSVSGLAARPKL